MIDLNQFDLFDHWRELYNLRQNNPETYANFLNHFNLGLDHIANLEENYLEI